MESERLTGIVKWFDNKRGFGFIEDPRGGQDHFVHYSAIEDVGYKHLREGEEVSFVSVPDSKRSRAKEVRKVREL